MGQPMEMEQDRTYKNPTEWEFRYTWASKVGKSLLDHYAGRQDDENEKWIAPFQFTLPMCAAIYSDFISTDFKVRGQEGSNDSASFILQQKAAKINNLNFPDPKHPDWAMRTPIRAVEFLSWEEATRVFLARRIYPIYFDFLSYSSCHERWGAVGHMLEETIRGKGPLIYEKVFSRRSLPFLKEAERLNFSSIFTFPVLKSNAKTSGKKESSQVLGAFVIFLGELGHQPGTFLNGDKQRLRRLRTYLTKASRLTAKILEIQAKMLGYARDGSFREQWNKEWDNINHNHKHPLYYCVEIKFANGRLNKRNIASRLLSQLGLADQFVVEDQTDQQNDSVTLLMVPSSEITRNGHDQGVAFCKSKIMEALFRISGPQEVLSIRVRPGKPV